MGTIYKNKNGLGPTIKLAGIDVATDSTEPLWEKSWIYIKTVIDVVREPILILDKDLRVMTANESFCRMFQVECEDTKKQLVYELGNGQWNIPALRKLLEDILPKNTFFKGFEVDHEFPFIGRKAMILNARKIHFNHGAVPKLFPDIILLAMEDVTDMMAVAETLASHAKQIETKLTEQTRSMGSHIEKLEQEIKELKSKANNSQK